MSDDPMLARSFEVVERLRVAREGGCEFTLLHDASCASCWRWLIEGPREVTTRLHEHQFGIVAVLDAEYFVAEAERAS